MLCINTYTPDIGGFPRACPIKGASMEVFISFLAEIRTKTRMARTRMLSSIASLSSNKIAMSVQIHVCSLQPSLMCRVLRVWKIKDPHLEEMGDESSRQCLGPCQIHHLNCSYVELNMVWNYSSSLGNCESSFMVGKLRLVFGKWLVHTRMHYCCFLIVAARSCLVDTPHK